MKITISKNDAPFPVTILHLEGKLDGTNYESLIEETGQVFADGVRDLIIDLDQLIFISSAGLVAMHQIALMFREEKHPDPDEGWAAYHAIDRDRGKGTQNHVKLLSPTRQVLDVLEMTGFNSFFEIFTDLPAAVASFHQTVPAMQPSLS